MDSPFQYLFGKVVYNWVGVPNFWEGWVENRAKRRKRPNFPGLRGGILQFVPETLEHPPYTFLMTNLLLLSQKLATKFETTVFLDEFHTVPST